MTRMVGTTGIITMTDLFFSIAGRALGLAPTIQPMITPLFAPMPFAAVDGDELFDIMTPEELASQRSDTTNASTTPASNTHLPHTIQPIAPAIAPRDALVSKQASIPLLPPVEDRTAITAYPAIVRPSAQLPVSTSE